MFFLFGKLFYFSLNLIISFVEVVGPYSWLLPIFLLNFNLLTESVFDDFGIQFLLGGLLPILLPIPRIIHFVDI